VEDKLMQHKTQLVSGSLPMRLPLITNRTKLTSARLVRSRTRRKIMRWTVSLMAVPVIVLSLFTITGRAANLPGIPPETVTDYIHAIIEADRTFYTIHVVERMQKQGGSPAAENWRAEKKTLPLPAQFLAEASDLSSKTGTKVRYRLISLWPINPHNAPDGEPEKKGLEAVREHPERSATSTV